jgi:hypothetical protein
MTDLGDFTPSGIEWRFTANKVRLGPFDAFVVIPPLVLFLMYIKFWTFMLALFVICVMWQIEVFLQMPLGVAARTLRRLTTGRRRSVVPWWKVQSL